MKWLWVTLILMVMASLGYMIYLGTTLEYKDPEERKIFGENEGRDFIKDPETGELKRVSEGTLGGGSGGGEGSGGGGGEGSSTPSCILGRVSYSFGNFVNLGTCISYSGSTCISKRLSCSVKVNNYDPEKGGVFEINFTQYFTNSSGTYTFESKIGSGYVAPEDFATISEEFTLDLSQGSNETVGCIVTRAALPEVNIC